MANDYDILDTVKNIVDKAAARLERSVEEARIELAAEMAAAYDRIEKGLMA